jgi:diguanylate cyclase (GGDEF)-like protein/PAS domain S-box-containing protein
MPEPGTQLEGLPMPARVGLIVLQPGRRIASMCTRCESVFGCRNAEVRGHTITELMPDFPVGADSGAAPDAPIVPLLEGRTFSALRSNGTTFPVLAHAFEECVGDGRRTVVVVSDMTDAARHETERQILARAIEQTADSVIVTTVEGTVTYVNPAFERVTGYTSAEVVGRSPSIVKSGMHTQDFYAHLWKTILAGEVFRGVLVNRRKDGELLHEEKTITPIRDEAGRIVSFVSTAKDVTDRVRSEESLRVMVNMDALTGLPNRNLFNDRLQQAIARARRQGTRVALLLIDLDRFKAINDAHGHEAGDRVLVALAQRLREAVRNDDTVARIGGDEFVVLLEAVAGCDEAAAIARKLVAVCRQPVDSDGRRHFVTCSIGASMFPEHGGDVSTLLRNADIAMYRAKAAGRNALEVFAAPMGSAISQRSEMESLLREAVGRGELALRYQPQVDTATGRILGVEALLRWRGSVLGDVPPAAFIPVLEDSGQIVEIGGWVLRTAIEQARAVGGFDPSMRLAVNISPRQFRDPGFLDLAREAFDSGRRAGVGLQFEITESLLMEDIEATIEKVREVAALGIRVALDDFGTGYSSLAYLQRFPLHVLKIDRSFIAQCAAGGTSMAIIRTIVHLARALGLATVAEGVETALQLRMLREAGCDAAQGHFLRSPVGLREALIPVAMP